MPPRRDEGRGSPAIDSPTPRRTTSSVPTNRTPSSARQATNATPSIPCLGAEPGERAEHAEQGGRDDRGERADDERRDRGAWRAMVPGMGSPSPRRPAATCNGCAPLAAAPAGRDGARWPACPTNPSSARRATRCSPCSTASATSSRASGGRSSAPRRSPSSLGRGRGARIVQRWAEVQLRQANEALVDEKARSTCRSGRGARATARRRPRRVAPGRDGPVPGAAGVARGRPRRPKTSPGSGASTAILQERKLRADA